MISRHLRRAVVEQHELICTSTDRGIGLPFAVAELDLEHLRGQQFHDGADLPTHKPCSGISSTSATTSSSFILSLIVLRLCSAGNRNLLIRALHSDLPMQR